MRQLPVLGLFTFRPEFEPAWVGLPNVGTLTLGRLDHNDVERMVMRLTGGRALPAEVMKQIVAKTDGNPLFVEELTKAVLESGLLVKDAEGYRLNGPLPPLAIPATLQDSLMARLDRLAPVKEIAQIGATIGREFSFSLIRALVGHDETALRMHSPNSRQAELVFRRGEPPEAVYISNTRWCKMPPMRACSKAAGNNCTPKSRRTSRRDFPTSWRASRKSWRTISLKPALLTSPSIIGSRPGISHSAAQRTLKP